MVEIGVSSHTASLISMDTERLPVNALYIIFPEITVRTGNSASLPLLHAPRYVVVGYMWKTIYFGNRLFAFLL